MEKGGTIALGVLLLLSYSIITIGGGHGMAPAGLAIVWVLADITAMETWSIVFAFLGLAGAILLVLSVLNSRHDLHRVFGAASWVALAGSAVVFTLRTEGSLGTTVSAIPFIGSSIAWWIRLAKGGFRTERDGKSGNSPSIPN